jgi:hypothetical protein
VAAPAQTREREIVLERFLELSPSEQLAVYRAVRDLLGARLALVKKDKVVEERATSLDVFKRVADHLALADGVAPTPAEFDAACRELDLDWNRSRVSRAWGRWRFGKEAFLGDSHDSIVRRRIRHTVDRRRRREAPLRGIRLWLAAAPGDRGRRAYEAWAREYNSDLRERQLPVSVSASNAASAFGIRWVDLVRHAAGEITLDEARKPRTPRQRRYSRGPHDLVALKDIGEILGVSLAVASYTARRKPGFPTPVIELGHARLWVRGDVEAYAAGDRFPTRRPNELRNLYVTANEAARATGLGVLAVRSGRHGFPEPAVQLRSVSLWLRSEVDAWKRAAA